MNLAERKKIEARYFGEELRVQIIEASALLPQDPQEFE